MYCSRTAKRTNIRPSKIFVVVTFLNREEVDVVPKTWIFEDSDGVTKCYWPKCSSYKARQKCIKYVKPNLDWRVYKVKVGYETSKYKFFVVVVNCA